MWLSTTATAQVLEGALEKSLHNAEGAREILNRDLNSGRLVEILTEYCRALRTHNTRDAADFEERLAAHMRTHGQA
jgi:hypothetical protein